MRAINRKLLRDLWHIRGQALAIALVIASGVAIFVMSLSTYSSLDLTSRTYFDRSRFGDVFAQLQRAPDSLTTRIREIPGVSQVQTRIVKEVTLDVPGLPEPATGRLISLPKTNETSLNALFLRNGRFPEPYRRDEVLASEAFMLANELEPGDAISAVLNGKKQKLQIVGTVLSPEYIISLGGGSIIPDDRRFGVLWMDHESLSTVYDMDGAFNDVSLTLRREALLEETLQRLDLLLEPYGGFESYGREDQLSYAFLSDELSQLKATSMITPSIFLGVSVFLLNVVVARIISTQREQIAMLKAFGYSNRNILAHYLKLILLIVGIGIAVGILGGSVLGVSVTEMYAEFYRFPIIFFQLDVRVVVLGMALTLFFALSGTFRTVLSAAKLPPAEAMRPEPPAQFRATVMERLGFAALLSASARMILRQLERRPFKTALSAFGVSLAVAVMVLGRFSIDAITYIMEHQFSVTQRQDITVNLVEESHSGAFHELRNLPGVMHAEAFRQVPVRLRYRTLEKELSLTGIEPDGELFRIMNADAKPVPLPPEGVILSEKLAEILHVVPGDEIRVEVLDGERQTERLRVTSTISDFSGTNAYLSIDALRNFLGEGATLSGAYLQVDEREMNTLYKQLKETPRVSGVTVLSAARESFQKTVGENLLIMNLFNVIFGCVIAIGVVYNTARISLSERSRELATLRVIGFTRAEVSSILLGELAFVTLIAIPIGLLIGYGFSAFLSKALETDMYRIPLALQPYSFGFSAVVIMLAALVSGLIVRRKVDHFDLIAVLKSRD
ncbi:MAG: FtsX-like permease family protein [Planctomycetaceae bacterium]|nr:FtsX-like permease family protein [Planctomycetaceae bacterium]